MPAHARSMALRVGPLMLFLLTSAACRAFSSPLSAPTPTATAAQGSPTPVSPLYKHVTLTTVTAEEKSAIPQFDITTQTPALSGSDDPRVQTFNQELVSLVNQAVVDFKQNLTSLTPPPDSLGSSFDMRYSLVSPPGDILSIKFEMMGYVAGAAHPYHVSRTTNFHLEQGKDLALAELFVPGSDYLKVISQYCIGQLRTRDIDFADFEAGAAPTPDNYRNWNISADGLMITFDEYQVGPYAAGPQVVTIPYAALAQWVQPNGPLAPFVH